MVGYLQNTSREDSQRSDFRISEEGFLCERLVDILRHLHEAAVLCGENFAEDGMEICRLVRTYEKVRRVYYNVVKLNGGGPHGPNARIRKMKEKSHPENQPSPPQWEQFQRAEEKGLRQLLFSMQIHLRKAMDPQGNNFAKGGTVAFRLVRTYEKLSAIYYNVVELNGGGPDDAATQIRQAIRLKTGGESKRRSMKDLIDQGDIIL